MCIRHAGLTLLEKMLILQRMLDKGAATRWNSMKETKG
jgi:hypothetical protein